MKTNDFRKTILLITTSCGVLAGVFVWLRSSEKVINPSEVGMIGAVVLMVGFALFLGFRRLRSLKENLPAEDEMSKKILRRGAATSYYVSMYMWLAFMFFEERINLERSTLIGAGILGMAVIYALSWIYHMYIKRSND